MQMISTAKEDLSNQSEGDFIWDRIDRYVFIALRWNVNANPSAASFNTDWALWRRGSRV